MFTKLCSSEGANSRFYFLFNIRCYDTMYIEGLLLLNVRNLKDSACNKFKW